MLTSKSTRNCRLSANAPHVIRVVGRTGLTTGTIDKSDALGKTRRKGKGTGTVNRDGRCATVKSLSRREKASLYRAEKGIN